MMLPTFHQTAVISKLNFNHLFKEAGLRAVTPQVLASGFRKSGVYPLYRARISIPKQHIDGDGDSANSSSPRYSQVQNMDTMAHTKSSIL